MCGICGAVTLNGDQNSAAAQLVVKGLYHLQHRGHQAAGIAVGNGKSVQVYKGLGKVSEVIQRENIETMRGRVAIGHVRYGTAGGNTHEDAHPHYRKGIAVVHNGNFPYIAPLRKKLEKKGLQFSSSGDTEVLAELIAKSNEPTLEKAVVEACMQVRGSYALLVMSRDKIVAVRDPHGIRPMSLGLLQIGSNSYCMLASESCVFPLNFVREIEPGEVVTVTKKGAKCWGFLPPEKRRAFCIFEWVYFSRPDSYLSGRSTYEVRKKLGRNLARESKASLSSADLTVPVLESGICAALGFAAESGIPYEPCIIKNPSVGRTFITPGQKRRLERVGDKHSPVTSMVAGKRLNIIDDSIVRASTAPLLCKVLKKHKAREIHFRIASPPITHPCLYGIDTPTKKELIAAYHSQKEIAEIIGADSLQYLSLEGMIAATGMPAEDFCLACFNGEYPV